MTGRRPNHRLYRHGANECVTLRSPHPAIFCMSQAVPNRRELTAQYFGRLAGTYGSGEYKVHDLENLGDKEMVFMTIEFLNSANKPLAIPDKVRAAA